MEAQYQMQPKPKYHLAKSVSYFCFGLVVITAMSVLGVNGAALLLGDWFYDRPEMQLLINDLAAYLVGLPLALIIWHVLPAQPMPLKPRRSLSLGLFVGYGLFSLALAYAASFLTQLFLLLFQLPQESPAEQAMVAIAPIWSLLLVAVVPAIVEELIFRGMLYRYTAPYGEKVYVLLSGFLFGLFHGNLSQIPFAFVLGCSFALLCYRTGTMLYGMLLHFFINFLSACVLTPELDNPGMAVFMGLWMPMVLALGITFGILQRKGLILGKGRNLPKRPVAAVLLNPGMLTFLIFMALMVFLSIFMPQDI